MGGLIGSINFHNGSLYNSYSIGKVQGLDNVGGLIGSSNEDRTPRVYQSYWDIETSGVSESFAGVGKTTEEMRKAATFNNWDFDDIWEIDEGKSYPQLRGVSLSQLPPPPLEPTDPSPVDPTPTDPDPIIPDPVTPTDPDPVVPTPDKPTTPAQPSNPEPSQPTPTEPSPSNPDTPVTPSQPSNPAPTQPTPSNPGNSNTGSTQKPVYDGNDEYGGNYIYVDNLPASDRQNFGFILPGTPVYVIDKEISSTKPDMYVVDLDKYNANKNSVSKLKWEIEELCDKVTKKGTFDIATTALRVEIQKLFSMFFNTEFLLDSKKFSSNTMKAIKSVLENDHAKNLLKSNSYRLTVGYYLVLYSYLDEAVAALNKAESILESPVRYADSVSAYRTYMREAEKYMDAARQVYANEPQITALFNEFAIYETAATFAGAITDTVVDKIDSKLSKFLIPDAGVMTKSVEQSIKMQAKKEAKAPMKMKTLTAEDIWQESTSFTLSSSGAKSIFERNFNEIFG